MKTLRIIRSVVTNLSQNLPKLIAELTQQGINIAGIRASVAKAESNNQKGILMEFFVENDEEKIVKTLPKIETTDQVTILETSNHLTIKQPGENIDSFSQRTIRSLEELKERNDEIFNLLKRL